MIINRAFKNEEDWDAFVIRVTKIHEKYEELKSYNKVAKEFGVTRERIRQLLVKGAKYGVIDFCSKHEKISKFFDNYLLDDEFQEKVHDEIRSMSLQNVAKKYGIVEKDFRSFFNKNFPGRLKKLHAEKRSIISEAARNRTLEEYSKYLNQLGYHPSSYWLQIHNRTLYARITRLFGGIEKIRAKFPSYPKIPLRKGLTNF